MQPFFIPTRNGAVFALFHPPSGPDDHKRNILFIPPFAEELNRSRHMINRQARAFADAGYGVLILDLYGTGDSEGTFGEATVDIWQQDIMAALCWLGNKSHRPPILWAMRSGALIAADLIQHNPGMIDQLILWSPVNDGKKFISQYLRIKLAADLTGTNPPPQGGLKELWARLEQGDSLEIGGYRLSSALALMLATLSLGRMELPPGLAVKWIDISPLSPAELSPAANRVINAWNNNGINISTATVKGPAFWTLQEPEWAEAYIDQTMKLILSAGTL